MEHSRECKHISESKGKFISEEITLHRPSVVSSQQQSERAEEDRDGEKTAGGDPTLGIQFMCHSEFL